MTSEKLLQVEDLKVSLGKGPDSHEVVRGISFAVARGESLGIIGESGCGKSVTAMSILRLLGKQLRISGGAIRYEGRDLSRLSARELRAYSGSKIGMIFQDPMGSLNPLFKVRYQMQEPLKLHRNLSDADIRKTCRDLLSEVGIRDPERVLDQYPFELSGGMRQRVMIAMAVAARPRLLICDEPTTALDVTIQAQILRILEQMKAKYGMSMIVISHDIGVVDRLVDKIAVMYAGEIVEIDVRERIIRSPRHPYTRSLIQAARDLDTLDADLPELEGSVPGVTETVTGCRFHPRCAFSRPRCEKEHPALTDKPEGTGQCRCFYAEQVVQHE